MGFLDVLYLGSTGTILLVSSILLIVSLKSTDDQTKQRTYKKTYTPVIALSIMALGLYAMVVGVTF